MLQEFLSESVELLALPLSLPKGISLANEQATWNPWKTLIAMQPRMTKHPSEMESQAG